MTLIKPLSASLNQARIGLWTIEIKNMRKPEMYVSEFMLRELLGVSASLTPCQLYDYWYGRIHPDYVYYIQKAIEQAADGKKIEVEYPWRHENDGWLYIRCGGSKDRDFKGGLKLSGYHQDITALFDFDIRQNERYEVRDIYKMNKYSAGFMSACDAFYEVNPETYFVKTIFCKKNKYVPIPERCSIEQFIHISVHPKDGQNFLDIFKKAEILFEHNDTVRTELRFRQKNGGYLWTQAVCVPFVFNGRKSILFYIEDIRDKKKMELLSREKEDLIRALVAANSTIVDVNMKTENIKLLKCEETWKTHFKLDMPLQEFIPIFISQYIQPCDRQEAEKFLSPSNLKAIISYGKEKYIDLRLETGQTGYEWIRISVLILESSEEKIFLLMKNISRDYMLQDVMEKFVYKNCDDLFYIDMQKNWYLRFCGDEVTGAFSEKEGKDYIEAMTAYADEFVASEDREYVKNKTHPAYVLDCLNREGYLSFTFGVFDKGQYARKLVQFHYYDKAHQIVLLQRTDITESYNIQKDSRIELEKMKKEAVTDYLTGITNRSGCEKEIEEYFMTAPKESLSAFLLVDLDNFKSINDKLGHQQGDQVLKEVAGIIKSSYRNTDIVARLGGDEFVVFMKNVGREEVIYLHAEDLLKKLALVYENGHVSVKIGASIGIALAPRHGKSFKALYERADKALYKGKLSGKNQFCIYEGKCFEI